MVNLAKTLHIWLEATHLPLQSRGIHVPDKEVVDRCFGRVVEGFTELGIKDIETAIYEMDARAKELLPDVELYPDTLYALEELQKMGKKIALITTSLRENVVKALDKYEIQHFFDVIVTNEDTERHKPNPEPLFKALEQLGGSIEEAIMIGDSDKDVDAAKNAGVDSILFFPEEHMKFYVLEDFQKLEPTHIIQDFREVLDIVRT